MPGCGQSYVVNILIFNDIRELNMDNPPKVTLELPRVVSYNAESRSDILLVSVERTAGGHIVDLVPYGLKNLGVLLGSFLGDTIDNIGVLGHGAENGVDQLDDLGHVLLHETSGSDGRCADP